MHFSLTLDTILNSIKQKKYTTTIIAIKALVNYISKPKTVHNLNADSHVQIPKRLMPTH